MNFYYIICIVIFQLLKYGVKMSPTNCIYTVNTEIVCEYTSIIELSNGVPSNVTHLTLPFNLFINQSEQFKSLSSLKVLRFSSSPITALPSNAFSSSTSLTELYLNNTQITSLPSDAFNSLTSLTLLNLSSNQITSLPPDLFKSLNSLKFLGLNSNQISSLPSNVFKPLNSLTFLELSSNQISNLPSDVFSFLTSLTFLNLNSNQISSLPSDLFSSLQPLKSLSLSFNNISRLPSDIFKSLASLTYLELSFNKISVLPSDVFEPLTSLNFLDLYHNQISSLPSDVFNSLNSLRNLDLSFNKISRLSSEVFNFFKSLTFLNLSYNLISSLPSDVFKSLTSLTTFQFSFNNLSIVQPDLFTTLTSLEVLDLQYNQIASLPPNVFQSTTLLDRLLLNGNPLNCDCDLATMSELLQSRKSNIFGECLDNTNSYGTALAQLKVKDMCCSPNADLVSLYGSNKCVCKDGYQTILGYETSTQKCEDIDECFNDTSPCTKENTYCVNEIGTFSCHCRSGWMLDTDGSSCVDFNEEKNGTFCTKANTYCVNEIGTFSCCCQSGFIFNTDSGSCVDNDECINDTSPCLEENTYCVKENEIFSCSCQSGFVFNTNSCSCDDIDECTDYTLCTKPNNYCFNEIGTFSCRCQTGFVFITGINSCVDIDECLNVNSPCKQNNTECVNENGTFSCPCKDGWYYDGYSSGCVVITMPRTISVKNEEKQKLNLYWTTPEFSSDVILGYFLCYQQVSMDGVLIEMEKVCEETGNVTAYNITNLGKYSNYSIQLSAKNSNGESAPAVFYELTQQDVPTNVQNVDSLSSSTETSIFVKWNASENVYGILRGYTVYYKKWFNSTWLLFTQCNQTKNEICLIDNLSPYTNYTIKVLVENDVESNSTFFTIATKLSAPPNYTDVLPVVKQDDIKEDRFKIQLIRFSEINGPIRDYHVMVKKLESSNLPEINPASYSSIDIQRKLDGIYLAGIISDKSQTTFLVGSGLPSKRKKRESQITAIDARNPSLSSETYYTVFLRGYVSDSVYQTTGYYAPVKTAKSPSNNSLSIIIGTVVGVGTLILLLIGAASYFIIRRYRKKMRAFQEQIVREEETSKKNEQGMKRIDNTYHPDTFVNSNNSYQGLADAISEGIYESVFDLNPYEIPQNINSSLENSNETPRTLSLTNSHHDEKTYDGSDEVNQDYLDMS